MNQFEGTSVQYELVSSKHQASEKGALGNERSYEFSFSRIQKLTAPFFFVMYSKKINTVRENIYKQNFFVMYSKIL